ncbi:MAG: hypothetical protein Tsb0034_23000 [Ekhidna sp.]
MLSQTENLESPFEEKVRVRACGLLIEKGKVLLLKHDTIGPEGYLWSPPGGGVAFGEQAVDALKKEFLEETNLKVEVGRYLFANEFIDHRHHAIELFFEVRRVSGNLKLGIDPELSTEKQILTDARFFSFDKLKTLPKNALHNIFSLAEPMDKIIELRGLYTFKY